MINLARVREIQRSSEPQILNRETKLSSCPFDFFIHETLFAKGINSVLFVW